MYHIHILTRSQRFKGIKPQKINSWGNILARAWTLNANVVEAHSLSSDDIQRKDSPEQHQIISLGTDQVSTRILIALHVYFSYVFLFSSVDISPFHAIAVHAVRHCEPQSQKRKRFWRMRTWIKYTCKANPNIAYPNVPDPYLNSSFCVSLGSQWWNQWAHFTKNDCK